MVNMKESITIRLTARTRFGLELLMRKQHRTLTSVVEWALQHAINMPKQGLIETNSDGVETNLLQKLWDIDEKTRIRKIAQYYPELLTFEEEVWLNAEKELENQ